jgi:hypothetical protein
VQIERVDEEAHLDTYTQGAATRDENAPCRSAGDGVCWRGRQGA